MTPANAAKCLGLLQDQKQSELTGDPRSLREGAGRSLDQTWRPGWQPAEAATEGRSSSSVLQGSALR